jgi:GPH family glycoside/pentoside/hexuronide:cation symporter
MENKYLSFGRKLAYGSGDFASNLAFTFVSSFILIYLTDTVGLDSKIIGILMMISKLLDGVTDVFFGTLIDKTHSKMGKARPWMFWSTFPLGICVVLQFATPNAAVNLQYAYFFVIYTLMNAVFYTANNISYSAMSALITKNTNERVQLGVFRFIFALISAITISSITMGLVNTFGGGTAGWRMIAIIYAVALMVINTVSVLCVKEIPTESNDNEKVSFFNNLKYLTKNKYYLMILGIYILQNAMGGISNGVGIYFMAYVLGDGSLLGLFSMVGMLPMIIGLAFTPMLVKKWGMYKVNLIGMLVGMVICIPTAIAGLNKAIFPMLVFMMIRGFFFSPLTGTLTAIIAETSNYTRLKDNVQVDGVMFSCSSMGVKLGGGIGSAICGWLLAAGGYNGLAEIQTTSALNMITFMYVLVPPILYGLMTLIVWRLDIEKANKELSEKSEILPALN